MANRIISCDGPHEGVGKSTLAVNLAARIAQFKRTPIVLIDTDPLCRGEDAQIAGATSGGTVNYLLDQLATKMLSLATLRNRIPLNRFGIGSLTLAPSAALQQRLFIVRTMGIPAAESRPAFRCGGRSGTLFALQKRVL